MCDTLKSRDFNFAESKFLNEVCLFRTTDFAREITNKYQGPQSPWVHFMLSIQYVGKLITYSNMNRQHNHHPFSFENPALRLLVRKGHGFVLCSPQDTFWRNSTLALDVMLKCYMLKCDDMRII